jgi:hypothetical protein
MDRKAPGFKIADKHLLSRGNGSCGHELHATLGTRCNARCAGDKENTPRSMSVRMNKRLHKTN